MLITRNYDMGHAKVWGRNHSMSGRDRSRTLSSDEHVLLGHAKMISNKFNYVFFWFSFLLVEARGFQVDKSLPL